MRESGKAVCAPGSATTFRASSFGFSSATACVSDFDIRVSNFRRGLAPWVKLLMNPFESRWIDMRVDLRGADAGVAEHFLNLSEVGAPGDQVRGEAVTQCVGAHA